MSARGGAAPEPGVVEGEQPPALRGAAFFDLDRTLLSINSAKWWFRRERADGRISRRQAFEAAGWLGLYGLGLMDGRRALGRAARTIEGQDAAELLARTQVFYDNDVRPHFAPGGISAVQAHQDEGTPVVLLTSATGFLARLVVQELGLTDALAMELGVADGLFDGSVTRFCYGPGKVAEAENWAGERGISLEASTFYTDSITDLPMLERVGCPRVVSPDTRLARVARKRGWPVLDWGPPLDEPTYAD